MNIRERDFQVLRATTASRVAMFVILIIAGIIASLPYWAGRDTLHDFTQIAAYLVFAMMWNLLAGYGGMVSIGQQAYFGIGGYVMLVLAKYCGVSPFLAVPVAGVVAVVIAVPVSRIAFR
ncbi:ABC transporter permease subunit, partial [Caballeronia sp.]|uniref:ABC transporter permease subunit n=1 Tax=Caballeronia sp. TaxID=1931223 RepID=UPI003C49DFA7